jgi:uncharacterized membrane protein YjjB (DUF3815 family)
MTASLHHLLASTVVLVAAACFAVVFRTPRRYFVATILVGFCSGTGLSLCPPAWHPGFSAFVTALAVACLSHVLARATRAPAQCFLIPGVMFLVPGTVIYRSFAAALDKRMDAATDLALQALTIALGVSFGLLLANLVVPPRKTL